MACELLYFLRAQMGRKTIGAEYASRNESDALAGNQARNEGVFHAPYLALNYRKEAEEMKIKRVMTWSAAERKFRLFRVMWESGTVGDGKGYSAKLAASLVPKLVELKRQADGWRATLAGLSLHYRRSYGGRFC